MTTEQLLDMKCDSDRNRQIINKALWKIKPVQKLGIPKGCTLKIEELEYIINGLEKKYDIMIQSINPYYDMETKEMIFYICSVQMIVLDEQHKTREWIGNTYGKTLWELYAKTIIFIVQKIKDQKEGKDIRRCIRR